MSKEEWEEMFIVPGVWSVSAHQARDKCILRIQAAEDTLADPGWLPKNAQAILAADLVKDRAQLARFNKFHDIHALSAKLARSAIPPAGGVQSDAPYQAAFGKGTPPAEKGHPGKGWGPQ